MQSRTKLLRAAATAALAVTLAAPQVSAAAAPAVKVPSRVELLSERVSPGVLAQLPSAQANLVAAVASFQETLRLGEDLVQVQLGVGRLLSQVAFDDARSVQSDAARLKVLAAAGIESPSDLRHAAASLRVGRTSVSQSALKRARRVVGVLYPSAPGSLSAAEIALVLESAAVDHDRRALADAVASSEDKPALLSALQPGEMVPGSVSASRVVSLPKLFAKGAALHARYITALSKSARLTLASGHVTDVSAVSDLTAAWVSAGYRRTNATLTALAQVGKTYRFASRGPDAFDCSGLTAYAWAHSGLYLATSSFSQREATTGLGSSSREALPGDLVFYKVRTSRSGTPSGHVALWLGFGSLIVEAQQNADQVHVAPISPSLFSSFGQVRLAGERTDALLLPKLSTHSFHR